MKNSDNKKRIAFYIGGLCKGGAERVICNLAEYFYEQDYEVFMVTKLKEKDEYELSEGISRIIADITPEEETGNRFGNLKARINKLSNIWREIEPDIIVSFIKKNNLMALASAKKLHISVVISVRSAPERELSGRGIKPLSFLLFRSAEGIVLQTSEAKQFFPKYLQKKAIILPNSLSTSFVSNVEQMVDSVNRKKEIISVGRIDDNKNQIMLINAFKPIAEKYPDWSVHLYGDGEGRIKLEQYVNNQHLDNQIFFHGIVDDVPSKMREASIFVLSSKVEGMPNALIEAMASGMACISTDCPCGGPRDLIEDGVNGFLVPVGNTVVLKERLELLFSNESYRLKLGIEAAKIIDRLHPDIVNNQWKTYIDGIISRRKK